MGRVGIIGVGFYGFRPTSSEVSFREMIFRAAQRAYENAGGIDPRSDVDAFISCQEDFWEGIAIANEFMPDQLGGVLKPGFTVAGDSLQCLLNAYAMIKTGAFDVVVIESHGKPSEILSMRDIILFSYDPIYIRPIEPRNIHFLAALEARSFMNRENLDREDLGEYVVRSLRRGLDSSRGAYSTSITLDDYIREQIIIDPFTRFDIASFIDSAVVVVLASENIARKFVDTPVWILGVWSVSGSPTHVYDDLSVDSVAREAADRVFRLSGLRNPLREIDVLELDERYSHTPLMVLKSIGFSSDLKRDLASGRFDRDGELPVNPSGGALSEGNPLEVHGLARVVAAYEQLMVRAGSSQIEGVERVLIHSRRWPSSRTTTIAVLSR
ncbi:MAG: thiolase domain-containing protein [Sulfolobales archaeon]